MSGLRTYGWLLCEEGVWDVITAIVPIVRPCVAHCVVEMIMKCFNVLRANPSHFMLLTCTIRVNVLF